MYPDIMSAHQLFVSLGPLVFEMPALTLTLDTQFKNAHIVFTGRSPEPAGEICSVRGLKGYAVRDP